ncbi:hypothetical protein ACVWWG_000568 [Bradyrhizobium sp. LB7.2]
MTTSATVGPRQFAEPRDLAGLVHAHLDDPETGIGPRIAQRQRHAPEIVEARRAGIGAGIGGQKLLGAGLAGAAGEPDHRPFEACACGTRKTPETVDQRVLDDDLGNAGAGDLVRHDHRDRAGSFRLVRELPTITRAGEGRDEAATRRAAQRDEQAARFHQPAVLGDDIDRRVRE